MIPHRDAAPAQVMVRAAEDVQWRTVWAALLMFHSMAPTKLTTPRSPISIHTSR